MCPFAIILSKFQGRNCPKDMSGAKKGHRQSPAALPGCVYASGLKSSRSALEMGNRTLMMDDGNIVLDLSGDERTNLTVEGLLQKYRDVKGQMLDNDRILLSQ